MTGQPRYLTQKGLAQALDVAERSIRRWIPQGLPQVGTGRDAMYDEGQVRAWCARNGKAVRPPAGLREGAPAPPAPAAAPPPTVAQLASRVEVAAERAAILAELRDRDASPAARGRAAFTAAAMALADALESELGPAAADYDAFRKQLDALRLAEKGYLELERERGELIPRDVAKACMGALARRFVLACDRLGSRLASQVEVWLADGAFAELGVDGRGREVRAWAAEQTRQARVGESSEETRAELERLVADELEDQGG